MAVLELPSARGRLSRLQTPVGAAAVATVALYLVALSIADLNQTTAARWLAFGLWLLDLACVPAVLICQTAPGLRNAVGDLRQRPRHVLPLAIIVCLAIAFSFTLLVRYPFIAVYDQVRDGGLNVRELSTGRLPNPFAFGRYGAHGLVIPSIAVPFYRLFGASVLTWRTPAALLAVLDVLLLYRLMRRIAGTLAAFFAALTLLTLPLHLYYGRSELVVICSCVLMTVLLLLLRRLVAKASPTNAILLGLAAGFSATFHGSILTIAAVTLIIAVAGFVWRCQCIGSLRPLLWGAPLLLGFAVVGFGPKLLFVTPSTFLHTGEAFGAPAGQVANGGQGIGSTVRSVVRHPIDLAHNYWTSLQVYVREPTRTLHYPDWHPLLDPLVSVLLLVGVVAAIRSRNTMLRLLVAYAAIIPFTNSAITNSVNGDNRLAPAYPVAAALAGYGAAVIVGVLRRGTLLLEAAGSAGGAVEPQAATTRRRVPLRRTGTVVCAVAFAYLLLRGVLFFAHEPAMKGYTADDYLTMHALTFIHDTPAYRGARQICMAVSPDRFSYFDDSDNRLLTSEQFQYFLPGTTVRIYSSPDVSGNELALSTRCDTNPGHYFALHEVCHNGPRFVCPPAGVLRLYAEDDSLPARPAEGIPFLGVAWVIEPTPTYIP